MPLADAVQSVLEEHKSSDKEHSSSRPHVASKLLGPPLNVPPKRRSSGYSSAPGSPAGRTGPPSSSFPISSSISTAKGKGRALQEDGGPPSTPPSRMNSQGDPVESPNNPSDEEDAKLIDPYRKKFKRSPSGFRGAWEYDDQETPGPGRNKKQRDSWIDVDAWNPIKWLGITEAGDESDGGNNNLKGPKSQKDGSNEGDQQGDNEVQLMDEHPRRTESPGPQTADEAEPEQAKPGPSKPNKPPRSFSLPHMKSGPAWSRLKALLPQVAGQSEEPAALAQERAERKGEVDMIKELTYGGLAPLLLRMWFERDERDERRVPILMHQLRIRVSDSIYPLSNSKAVFRIECEYAKGTARWVIYRQLRDFRKLNRHYRLANFYTLNDVKLPDFPNSGISKIHFYRLKREKGSAAARAEFAKMQREILENYIIGLIKAVMFEASSNRLARFLEVSALSIAFAHSGGTQLKAGILKLEPSGIKKDYGRKSTGWRERRKGRWCAVRESYLVVMKEAGELEIYDVFLLDSEFTVERPTRYYRQGLRAISLEETDDDDKRDGPDKPSRLTKMLHRSDRKAAHDAENTDHEDAHEDQAAGAGALHPLHATGSTSSAANGDVHHMNHHHHHHHHHHQHDDTSSRHQGAYRSSTIRSKASQGGRSSVSTARSTILSRLRSIRSNREGSRRRSGSTDSSSSHSSSSSATSDMVEPAYKDPSTNVNIMTDKHKQGDEGVTGDEKANKRKQKDLSHHTFFIENSQMRLKLVARTERQTNQWISALERMKSSSYWYGKNRFNSFAPIRLNVAVQWLVDGRDYFWNLSRAIQLAKKSIYIHGWWLSPELYLRRPAKEHHRLDRLLKRKAQEGVMVYVIVYKEVSNRTTPTDSNYTKQLLTHLHPNIMVQRSPSHFATGTFYWAHHEKMCVIDETIAFMGGLDACYGRWDTPQHVLIDNGEPEGAEGSQIWIGKDYSNPRIMDFHDLNKPEQDMYDRSKVARMPWHDVSLQVVGQPARDLCRHFVQRWNFLLRVKNHSRRMPFLLPPAEFKPGELTSQGLTGTCEMQICRSAGPWSMGTLNRIEKSIQTAYLKAIQMSEHFVYIENQFFITSTVVGDIEIENAIGDALVNRIIKAYRDKTKWRACILLPLLPGFTFPVDHDSASAIRIILECQNRTISRGPHSIFTRLRKEGIDPDDYISFFSLRGWGKLPGDVLTTEQVYIHAKLMIVDDRLAIIGSANINERSMRGDRDSELAAIIRDTDLIEGTMAGKSFKVGRFAHTLRVRLMREHLGVDVDSLYEEDIEQQPDSTDPPQNPDNIQKWDPDNEQEEISPQHPKLEKESFKPIKGETSAATRLMSLAAMNIKQVFSGADAALAYGQGEVAREIGVAPGRGHAMEGDDAIEEERQQYGRDGQKEPGFASSKVPTLEEKTVMEKRPKETSGDKPLAEALEKGGVGDEPSEAQTKDGELYGAPADAMPGDHEPPHARTPSKEDADDQERGAVRARTLLRKHMNVPLGTKNWTIPTPSPIIDPHGFEDPVSDKFFKDIWIAAAVHNTETYRQVFHAVPDDMVTTWKQYREFIAHHERLQKPARDQTQTQTQTQTSSSPEKPPVGRVPSEGGNSDIGVIVTDTDTDMGAGGGAGVGAAQGKVHKEEHSTTAEGRSNLKEPKASETNVSTRTSSPHPGASGSGNGEERSGSPMASHQRLESQSHANPSQANQAKKKPAGGGGGGGAGEEPFEPWEREFMEELLNDVRGHLVLYPTRFLEGEDIADNFLFNADRLLPLPIYN